jgi:ADP-ribose pyrophosphatase YjhB (NUDIX family)
VATPDFIRELRTLIGTRPLWLSGATAVVVRADSTGSPQVLLVRRTDTGEWSPVSGIVDPGEHPATTAVREVAEEAGVSAEVEHLAWVTVTDLVTYENGDQTRYLDHVFRCRWTGGDPYPADGEATEAAFFAVDQLPPLRADYAERVAVALSADTTTRLT